MKGLALKTSQLLMIDLSGPSLTPDERAFLTERRPGGVCIFGRNVIDRFQVADYVSELHALAGDDLLVAVDQEGGGVLRIEDVPAPPAAMALGAADDPALTRAVAAATARGLTALGINVDFAPVADVNANPANPVIADRSFGADPRAVARHVVAFLQGLQQEGVAATLKHFPGHGDTDTDSHLALPSLALDLAGLEQRELIPFRAGIAAGAAAVMSAHILVPALDDVYPASLSRALAHELLRERLGFDGVVFSDALNMRAIADRFGAAEAGVLAWSAGVDMPVHVGPLVEHAAVLNAVEVALASGRLDRAQMDRSCSRVRRLARRYPGRRPGSAWRDGDDKLLDEAARRGLVRLGELPLLRPGMRVVMVAADVVRSSAASQLRARPADRLADALERVGVAVTRVGYGLEDGPPESTGKRAVPALSALMSEVCRAVADTDAVLFVSTARTPMSAAEVDIGNAVAAVDRPFVHVAMWNPYHAAVLPGPALLSFGFGERAAAALARAMLGAEVTGVAPVPLRTLPG